MINNVNKPNKKCPNNTMQYVVKSGDTLYKIATRNKTTIEVLLELNPELNTNLLIPGIVMCVPTSVTAPPTAPPVERPPSGMPTQPMAPPTEPMRPTQPMTPPTEPMRPMQPMTPPIDMPIPPAMPQSSLMPVFPGTTEPECSGQIRYTIKHGDTLYNLARRYDITLFELLNANRNVNPYNLQVGQVICIPMSTTKCPFGNVYTVVAGDTLETILSRFRISLTDLREVNENFDPYNLRAGMRICIPAFMAYDDCPTERTYVIQAGDNLSRISNNLMISTSDILAFNPNMRPDDFSNVGVKICLPLEAVPYR